MWRKHSYLCNQVALRTTMRLRSVRRAGCAASCLPSSYLASPVVLLAFNSSLPVFSQPRGQGQHKRIVNLSISSTLRYRNLLWSGRPLRNSIMSCSVFAVALENLWILLLKICLKKKIFLMKLWVTKQPLLLIIAFLTRGIFGSCWGRDLSRLWMINPSVEHNQRLPYKNSGVFHADS